jgi:hypothetical protein
MLPAPFQAASEAVERVAGTAQHIRELCSHRAFDRKTKAKLVRVAVEALDKVMNEPSVAHAAILAVQHRVAEIRLKAPNQGVRFGDIVEPSASLAAWSFALRVVCKVKDAADPATWYRCLVLGDRAARVDPAKVEENFAAVQRCVAALDLPDGREIVAAAQGEIEAAAPATRAGDPKAIMLKAIEDHPKSANATPEELIGTADIGNKPGRDALRELEAEGRYRGFKRVRPARYRR